jgi:hypothetical protein
MIIYIIVINNTFFSFSHKINKFYLFLKSKNDNNPNISQREINQQPQSQIGIR